MLPLPQASQRFFNANPTISMEVVNLMSPANFHLVPLDIQITALQVVDLMASEEYEDIQIVLGLSKDQPTNVVPDLFKAIMNTFESMTSKFNKGGLGPSDNNVMSSCADSVSVSTATAEKVVAPTPVPYSSISDIGLRVGLIFVRAVADESVVVSNLKAPPNATLEWVEAALNFICSAVCLKSGARVMTNNGIVPSLISLLQNRSKVPDHLYVIALGVLTLESCLSRYAPARLVFRSLGGVEAMIDRIYAETSIMFTSSEKPRRSHRVPGSASKKAPVASWRNSLVI